MRFPLTTACTRHSSPPGIVLAVAAGLFAACLPSPGHATTPDLSACKGGVIVHVGCGNGDLLRAYGLQEEFAAIGLCGSRTAADALRSTLRAEGYGSRVLVDEWNGTNLPFVDNFVSALVLEDAPALADAEALRAVAPGGRIYRPSGGSWVASVKPYPADMDEWTHFDHAADANPISADRLVGPPRQLQWRAKPSWTKLHFACPAVHVMVAGGGRFFAIVDEGPTGVIGGGFPEKFALVARDAFSGKFLWRQPLSPWGSAVWNFGRFYWGGTMNPGVTDSAQRRLVVDGDRLYTVLGYNGPVVALDAATGEVLRTFPGTEGCTRIQCHNGRLYVAGLPAPKKILVLDPATGAEIWSSNLSADFSIRNNRLCLLLWKNMVALDATTYAELWTSATSSAAYSGGFIFQNDQVVVTKTGTEWRVHDAATGAFRWAATIATSAQPSGKTTRPGQIFSAAGRIWTFASDFSLLGLNSLTGATEVSLDVTNALKASHHHRCLDDRGTERYFITSQEGVEFLSLEGGTHEVHNWTRPTCNTGLIPANGLLYVPPHACGCAANTMLRGLYAFAPSRPDAGIPFADGARLVAGPAYGQVAGGAPAATDWPTYRHDASRTAAAAAAAVPKQVKVLWGRTVGETLTPPTVAGGRLFVADKANHSVFALDAATGEPLWTYRAGGVVNGPPTAWGNAVVFGCGDGRVYCLRAADGALVWRFQAAPRDCRNTQLEHVGSVWPVISSVMVDSGTAYFAAGYSSRLDGGLWAYATDVVTGTTTGPSRVRTDSVLPPYATNERPGDREGVEADLFVKESAGRYFMRCIGFDTALAQTVYPVNWGAGSGLSENGGITAEDHLFASNGFLDDDWFHRMIWTYNGIHGQMLAVDDTSVYGVKAYDESGFDNRFQPGQGYILFAQNKTNSGGTVLSEPGLDTELRPHPMSKYVWWDRLPVRVQTLVRAGSHLYAAGPPDVFSRADPFGPFEGRAGGTLYTLSPTTGQRLAELALTSPPVYDGMAAAGQCLYMSTCDGRVVCLGQPTTEPVAVATVTPPIGTTTTTFAFSGTASQDADGSIAGYEWRINGAVASSQPTFSTTFATTGPRAVTLTVWDDDGLRDAAAVGLCVRSNSTDSDNDGLEDAWEIAQAGNLSLLANSDPDGDGLTALDEQAFGSSPLKADTDADGHGDAVEMIAGTDPASAQSALAIDGVWLTGGTPTVRWKSIAGRQYAIWGGADPAQGFDVLVADHLGATPPTNTYADPVHRGPAFFYRVEVIKTPYVPPLNQPPTIGDDDAFAVSGTAVTLSVLANDRDPDFEPVAVSGVTQAARGTVVFTGSTVTYTPAPGWTGTDTFTYTAVDAAGHAATAGVAVYVKATANLVADGLMKQSQSTRGSPPTVTDSEAGLGWYLSTDHPWQWDRFNEWTYAYGAVGDRAMAQVIADGKKTKGAGLVEFWAANQGADNVLRVKVFGVNGAFAYSMRTEAFSSGSGTLLYDSGDKGGENYDWKQISAPVAFGDTGYDYLVISVWTDQVSETDGDFQAVDTVYLGK